MPATPSSFFLAFPRPLNLFNFLFSLPSFLSFSLPELLDFRKKVLGKQFVLAIETLVKFIVEPGFRVAPIVFSSMEDDAQFGESKAFCFGVAFSFFAEVFDDAIIFFAEPLQGTVIVSQEGLVTEDFEVHSSKSIFSSFKIIVEDVSCILTHFKVSLDGLLYLVLVDFREPELFKAGVLCHLTITLWRAEVVTTKILELGFPFLILSMMSWPTMLPSWE